MKININIVPGGVTPPKNTFLGFFKGGMTEPKMKIPKKAILRGVKKIFKIFFKNHSKIAFL